MAKKLTTCLLFWKYSSDCSETSVKRKETKAHNSSTCRHKNSSQKRPGPSESGLRRAPSEGVSTNDLWLQFGLYQLSGQVRQKYAPIILNKSTIVSSIGARRHNASLQFLISSKAKGWISREGHLHSKCQKVLPRSIGIPESWLNKRTPQPRDISPHIAQIRWLKIKHTNAYPFCMSLH